MGMGNKIATLFLAFAVHTNGVPLDENLQGLLQSQYLTALKFVPWSAESLRLLSELDKFESTIIIPTKNSWTLGDPVKIIIPTHLKNKLNILQKNESNLRSDDFKIPETEEELEEILEDAAGFILHIIAEEKVKTVTKTGLCLTGWLIACFG